MTSEKSGIDSQPIRHQRQGAETPLELQNEIVRYCQHPKHRDHTLAQVREWLLRDHGYDTTEKNISKYRKMALDPKYQQPWIMEKASVEDAKLIIEVLAAVTYATRGAVSSFSDSEAEQVCKVSRLASDLDPYRVWVIAKLYLARNALNQDTGDLDHLLGFAPWRGPKRRSLYEQAMVHGWVKAPPRWATLSGLFLPGVGDSVDYVTDLVALSAETIRLYEQTASSPARRGIRLLEELARSPSADGVKTVIPILKDAGIDNDEVAALERQLGELQAERMSQQKEVLKRSIVKRAILLKDAIQEHVEDPIEAVMNGLECFRQASGVETEWSRDQVRAVIDDCRGDSKKSQLYHCERCEKPIEIPDFTAAERFCPECQKAVRETRQVQREQRAGALKKADKQPKEAKRLGRRKGAK